MADLNTELLSSIDLLAKRNVSSTPADLTVDATITAIANIDTGEYKVAYNGGTFSAYSLDPSIVYKKGDKIYILVPRGDFSSKKLILGYASYKTNVDYAERQRMTNQYIPVGPNWLSPEWYNSWRRNLEIVASNSADKPNITHPAANWEDVALERTPGTPDPQTRYPSDAPLIPAITTGDYSRIDSLLQHYSDGFEWFKIQADFRTDFVSSHSTGKYGLRVELLSENAKFLLLHKEASDALVQFQKGRITQAEYDTTIADINDRIAGIKAGHTEPEFTEEYFIQTYDLTMDNFNGNPYSYPQQVTQWAYFQVPKGSIRGLSRVSLFQDGEMATDQIVEYSTTATDSQGNILPIMTPNLALNNIYCSNIVIQWQQKVNLLDNLYYCWIETPKGDSLYAPLPGSGYGVPNVDLKVHLYYGYEEVTSPETCKIMWFREKLDYTEGKYVDEAERLYPTEPDTRKQNPPDPFGEDHLDAYHKRYIDYSGPGWIPIQYIKDNPDPWPDTLPRDPMDGRNYAVLPNNGSQAFDTLTVNIDAVPYEWRYQCVVVYKGNVIMKAFQTIKRADSIYNLDVEHLIPASNLGQQLHIIDYWHPPGDIDAATTIAQGNSPEGTTTAQNGRIIYFPEWWGRWWVDYGNLQYYSYLGLINYDATDDLLANFGPIDVDDLLINERLNFKVQVYGIPGNSGIGFRVPPLPNGNPDVQDISAAYSEIANLEFEIIRDDNAALLPWYGETSFFYNTDGTIQSTDSAVDHTAYARPEWFGGKTGLNYELVYLAPDGTIIGSADSPLVNPSSAWNSTRSMMMDVWCDANKVLHFHVRDIYDPAKTANDWIARLVFSDGSTIDSECAFQFASPGDRGSNGSEWKAPIWPTNYPGMTGFDNNTTRFTQEISNRPVPLLLNSPTTITDLATANWRTFTQDTSMQNHLVLRPFVRHATYGNVEKLLSGGGVTPDTCYFYKVYWDSAYEKQDLNASNPCLPFADSETSRVGWFSFRHLDTSGGFTNLYAGDGEGGVSGKVRTSELGQGRCAYTQWANNTNDWFGAIEVVYHPPTNATITAARCNFRFEIRARIDIYRCIPGQRPVTYNSAQWDPDGDNPQYGLVATINSSYPIDVIVRQNGAANINRYEIRTNWPTEVKYDPSGYNPRFVDENLKLMYGSTVETLNTTLLNTKPINLTTATQTINESKHYVFDPISRNAFWDNTYIYRYEPKTFTNWLDGRNGALYGAIYNNATQVIGWFVRNQQFNLDVYGGNEMINGWDGKSIDVNNSKGFILSPTVGAGWKNPYTNTFTGVIMGIDTSQTKSQETLAFGGVLNYQPNNWQDYINKSKYMTGVYGYQDGVCSFGIMENGTAFFGSAKGGRIIIDGSSATMYGGQGLDCDDSAFDFNYNVCANTTGGMYNRMRLSFLDIPAIESSLSTSVSVDNYNINSAMTLPTNYTNTLTSLARYFNRLNTWDGYSAAIASGTPAIEIGQYCPSTLHSSESRSTIELCDYNNMLNTMGNPLSSAEVPGNRRFMVTYDGNLYAMNAFIRGTVAASNIIGSQFLSSDGAFAITSYGNLAVGRGGTVAQWYTVNLSTNDLAGRWSYQIPYESFVDLNDFFTTPGVSSIEAEKAKQEYLCGGSAYKFYVASTGAVVASKLALTGGSIDIGTFHITQNGELINFGTSYFVGGFTGHVTSGDAPPSVAIGLGANSSGAVAMDVWGNIYCRGGLINLGNVYLGGYYEKNHTNLNAKNSPFTITTDRLLRTKSCFWPLHFEVINDESAWACLAVDPGFMPAFGDLPNTRYTRIGHNAQQWSNIDNRALCRIDNAGLWCDTIMLKSDTPADESQISIADCFIGPISKIDTFSGNAESNSWGFRNMDTTKYKDTVFLGTAGNITVKTSGGSTYGAYLSAGPDEQRHSAVIGVLNAATTASGSSGPCATVNAQQIVLYGYYGQTILTGGNPTCIMVMNGAATSMNSSRSGIGIPPNVLDGTIQIKSGNGGGIFETYSDSTDIFSAPGIENVNFSSLRVGRDPAGALTPGHTWICGGKKITLAGNNGDGTGELDSLRLKKVLFDNTWGLGDSLFEVRKYEKVQFNNAGIGTSRFEVNGYGTVQFNASPGAEFRLNGWTPEQEFGIHARYG